MRIIDRHNEKEITLIYNLMSDLLINLHIELGYNYNVLHINVCIIYMDNIYFACVYIRPFQQCMRRKLWGNTVR